MSLLRTHQLTKDYPGCRALDNVSVQFQSGKVNTLLGKNGSGKSTLVKCLAGAIKANSGEFYVDDVRQSFANPSEALRCGIAMVYQEMSLVPSLTVTENIFLGRMPKHNNLIDWKKAHRMAAELLRRMKIDIDPKQIVSRLSMWQCQVVEITKALSFEPKVLILDEPTSALAASEVSNLFEAIRELKNQDVIIIYISHKLHEIPQIADTVTVLRDGKLVGTRNIAEASQKDIIHMMFGEVTIHKRPQDIIVEDEIVLEVKHFMRESKFQDISFQLKKGEILGIAGMLGSGRTELLKSIFGADPYNSGEVIVNGKAAAKHSSPIEMKKLGLGLTPEDRKLEGLILIHSIQDNLCYASMDKTSNGWVENKKKRIASSQKQIQDLEIKVPDAGNSVNSLSGGNQQKVVLGNWLNTEPKIMLFDEPSRGIDVSAKQQIFEIMWEQARKGISSIFVSSELEELLEVCHRILVMRDGKIGCEADPDKISIEDLYALSMGEIEQ